MNTRSLRWCLVVLVVTSPSVWAAVEINITDPMTGTHYTPPVSVGVNGNVVEGWFWEPDTATVRIQVIPPSDLPYVTYIVDTDAYFGSRSGPFTLQITIPAGPPTGKFTIKAIAKAQDGTLLAHDEVYVYNN